MVFESFLDWPTCFVNESLSRICYLCVEYVFVCALCLTLQLIVGNIEYNRMSLTFPHQQKRIFWVWDHVIRCLARGMFSLLHTFVGRDVSLPFPEDVFVHVHKNGDHPADNLTNTVLYSVKHDRWFHIDWMLFKWYANLLGNHLHSSLENIEIIPTCDGLKNKYVWLAPWITWCNGFTCGCPDRR